MWVRGLKPLGAYPIELRFSSHPMWVRGLKRIRFKVTAKRLLVAPHVGAWIETVTSLCFILLYHVAPHVGAWIET